MPNYEGKVCDAIIRLLEDRTRKKRTAIRRPECDGFSPPVELQLRLGAQKYAVEHTRLNTFPGQIRTDVTFWAIAQPIEAELKGKLPGPGRYVVCLPTDPFVTQHFRRFRSRLMTWVRKEASALHKGIMEARPEVPTPQDYRASVTCDPIDFPYSITLQCFVPWQFVQDSHGRLVARARANELNELGTIGFVSASPDGVDNKRQDELRRALDRKCPKLARCKFEGGDRTVLVLEDRDFQLSDDFWIQPIMPDLLAERDDVPDEIYFIRTGQNIWDTWIVKFDETFWPLEVPFRHNIDDLHNITDNSNVESGI